MNAYYSTTIKMILSSVLLSNGLYALDNNAELDKAKAFLKKIPPVGEFGKSSLTILETAFSPQDTKKIKDGILQNQVKRLRYAFGREFHGVIRSSSLKSKLKLEPGSFHEELEKELPLDLSNFALFVLHFKQYPQAYIEYYREDLLQLLLRGYSYGCAEYKKALGIFCSKMMEAENYDRPVMQCVEAGLPIMDLLEKAEAAHRNELVEWLKQRQEETISATHEQGIFETHV